jgi:flagellar assembly protein FliH
VEALSVHTILENLEQALSTLDQAVAETLLDLAIELAQQMVRQELRAKPEQVLDVVREVLEQLFHPHATLYLHPEDAALARSFLGDQLSHAGHRIFEDEKLARGGCRVEAGGSPIDATMETRWRRITETIGRSGIWVGTGT